MNTEEATIHYILGDLSGELFWDYKAYVAARQVADRASATAEERVAQWLATHAKDLAEDAAGMLPASLPSYDERIEADEFADPSMRRARYHDDENDEDFTDGFDVNDFVGRAVRLCGIAGLPHIANRIQDVLQPYLTANTPEAKKAAYDNAHEYLRRALE